MKTLIILLAGILMLASCNPKYKIAVVGENAVQITDALQSGFMPGDTVIYHDVILHANYKIIIIDKVN